MNAGREPVTLQFLLNGVAVLYAHDEQMPNRCCQWMGNRQPDAGITQPFEILRRMALTRGVPVFEMAKLRPQDRRLDSVEPAVHAFDLVEVLLLAPMIRDGTDALDQIGVSTHDSAGIAAVAELLSGIEA